MEIIQTPVYTFDELSDQAKEKARAWWREGALHDGWWECVYADAKNVAELFGLDIEHIWFSGFSRQGDGACFEGDYRYKNSALAAVKAYAPQDTDLHYVVKALQDARRRAFYKLGAIGLHCAHVSVGPCGVDVCHLDDRWRDIGSTEDDIKKALRDFADWIYRQLEREYEYQTSDEQADEAIRANGYTFTEYGKRVG